MDAAFLEQNKEKLLEEKRRLEAELKRIREQPPAGEGTYPSRFPHAEGRAPDEEAEEVEQFANLTALEGTLQSRLSSVEGALEHMAKGKYGTCERCGKSIPRERLLHSPEATACTACAQSTR